MGLLHCSIRSASRSAKNILKAFHSNIRHSSYDTVKFRHTFSMGKPLKRGLLMVMLTHVCGEARRHTPALNMHDFTIRYVRGCNTLYKKNKTDFVCVKQSCVSRRAGATVALYLEDKWPAYIQVKNFFSHKREKNQITTAQNLLCSIGVPASEPNNMYFTSHSPQLTIVFCSHLVNLSF